METKVMHQYEDEAKQAGDEMDLDDFMDNIGGISLYQVLSAIASTFLCFCVSMMTVMPLFLLAAPPHRCALPSSPHINFTSNYSDEYSLNLFIPKTRDKDFNSCYRYAYNISRCSNSANITCSTNIASNHSYLCDYGYYFNRSVYKETVVTEWDLVCDRTTLKSVANSLFFFGCFIGSLIFGALSDWFGRKRTMLIICLTYAGFGLGVAFSPSFPVFVSFYVCIAGSTIGGYIVTHTYVGEVSNKKWRKDLMLSNSLSGAFGNVFIAPLAYFFRSWRTLQIVCSLSALIYIPIFLLTSESPRWLLSSGREKEACSVIQRYCRSKKVKFNDDLWERVVKSEKIKRTNANRRKRYSIKDLFRFPNIRIMSINIMFTWFVASMVYYGLLLNVANLAGDPYINTAINSAMDVAATILTFILTRHLSKTTLLCGSFWLSGASCIVSMILAQFYLVQASVILAVIGRLGASTSYKIIYLVTPELYPTVVRGIGMSLGSLSARVGGMLSPFTVQAQDSVPWLMQAIFGILGIVAGLLCLSYPDTSSIKLMSSLEETEEFCAQNMSRLFRISKSHKKEEEDRKMTSAPEENDSMI